MGLVKRRQRPAPSATYVAPLRDETFLSSTNISSVVGLSYGVNRPSKYGSNPVFTGTASSYDHHLVYTSAANVNGVVRMWNTVFPYTWSSWAGIAYAQSPDGITFTRPTVGLVSYGGNTNNSIILDAGLKTFGFVRYESSLADTPYIATTTWASGAYTGSPSANISCRIYTSRDGINFTLAKNMYPDIGYWSGGANVMRDLSSIAKRTDGTWIATYQAYPTSERRSIGIATSATSSLSSTWTDRGIPTGLSSSATNDQYYLANLWREGDVLLMQVCIFDGDNQFVYGVGGPTGAAYTDDRQWKFELWCSQASDGLTWTKLDEDWFPAGSSVSDDTSGEWDWGCVKNGAAPVRVGNDYRFYYSGSYEVHHPSYTQDAFVYQHRIGYATLGAGRIGQLGGTGEVVLSTVTGTAATSLTINCTGTVKVELLDGSSNVITGYSQADCESIPSDAYDHTVKWAGVSRTPASYKAKIYVTSGTVHRVTIKEA